MSSTQIETLENARYEVLNEQYPFPALYVEVNGRPCKIDREKALRVDGRYAALDYNRFQDFYVLIPYSLLNDDPEAEGYYQLHGYTSDPRYVALVRKFCDDVDSGRFQVGPVEIPAP